MRESRRSVGIDDFLLKIQDFNGLPENITAYPFYDRIALGIHIYINFMKKISFYLY